MVSRYHDVYAAWQHDPEGFWAEAARGIDWYRPFDKVFDPGEGVYGRWFAGATCNTCHASLNHGFIVIQEPKSSPYTDQDLTGRGHRE